MSNIVSEFKARFKNETIKGLYKWFSQFNWQESGLVLEHIEELRNSSKSKKFTSRQQNIMHLLKEDRIGILNISGTNLILENLDDETIDEVILFYNLKNPTKRYKEIQADINSPQSFLTRIPYSIINKLYQLDKVPFDRQIFVGCLIRYNVWHGAQYEKELSPENAAKFESYFPQDDFTLDILLAVFEMELGVNNAFYLDREHNIAAVIFALIKNEKYTKTQIQLKTFEGFNNPLLKQSTQSWIKNVYNDLGLTIDDNIEQQEQIIGLLLNDVNLVVNHGIKLIKKMVTSPKFDWQLLVQSLEGIVYREKLNAGLKTLLGLLHKKFQKDPQLLEECCINLAPIFLQTDNKVQIAAKKIYELLPDSNSTITEAILPFVDTMHSEIKNDLAHLIGEEVKEELVLETYKQEKYTPKSLNEADELNYIQTEEDFIYLTSKVLKSSEFSDYELFLEALIRFHPIKDTHFSALKPALKQAERFIDQYSTVSARIGIHHEMAALLIVTWLKPDYQSVEDRIAFWKNELAIEPDPERGHANVYTSNLWLTHFKQFTRVLKLATHIIKKDIALPFLSISTHNNGQIHPQVFFERLQQYEAANKTPDQGDFDLALCRINRFTSFTTEKKDHSEYRKIVNYLFDPKAAINVKEIELLENSWVTTYALKNPNSSLQAILPYRNHKKWLNNSTWEWSLKMRDKKRKYAEFELHIDNITGNKLRKNGMPTIMPFDNHFSSYLDIQTFFVADASHWFNRNPFLLEMIYLKSVNQDFNWLNYLEANETRSVMALVIESAKNPKPIGKAGYLFLVLSLFAKDKAIRMATLDWLSLLIESKYLDIDTFKHTVTKLISNQHEHFIPIPRVCEQFDQLLQIQGVYLNVLEQTLEDLIPKMVADNLPRGFSKLLHYYYEVLNITDKKIPSNVEVALGNMRQVNTVKKVVVKILK